MWKIILKAYTHHFGVYADINILWHWLKNFLCEGPGLSDVAYHESFRYVVQCIVVDRLIGYANLVRY